MGIPYPHPNGSENRATAQEELKYYRNDLGKSGSRVFADYAYLSDPTSYRGEIAEAEHGKGPCNLRKWGVGSFHHSRALCGARIRQTPAGEKLQLGLLHVDDLTSATIPPQHWEVFDATPLASGGVVSTNLKIGGLVVVRD